MSEPKDLGVKIGTKEQAFYNELMERAEKALLAAKADVKVNEFVIGLCKEKCTSTS